MAGRWRRWSVTAACVGALAVAACSGHAGGPSDARTTPPSVIDRHAGDVAWTTVLPALPIGWQTIHTPEELTLQQAEAIFPAGSHLGSELSFAGYLRGVRRALAGACSCGGRMVVEERFFQFKTAGGAAEWFTDLLGSIYPMIGSPVSKLTPVRNDGGAYVAVAPKYTLHGAHVAAGVALEGDIVITELADAQQPLASTDVSEFLLSAERSAGRGITRAVPVNFPKLA